MEHLDEGADIQSYEEGKSNGRQSEIFNIVINESHSSLSRGQSQLSSNKGKKKSSKASKGKKGSKKAPQPVQSK